MTTNRVAAVGLALVAGAAVAVFLAVRALDEKPSARVVGSGTVTATVSAEATEVATPGGRVGPGAGTPPPAGGAPAMRASQVTGMRSCGQPVFVTAAGLPPNVQLRLERVDRPRGYVALATSLQGIATVDARPLFDTECSAGSDYTLRITDNAGRAELIRTSLKIPLYRGTIEVTPAAGGCESIVLTVRGMPANATVTILATEPSPSPRDGVFVLPEALTTDGQGAARSGPIQPPWTCDRPAVALVAFTSERDQSRTVEAELFYRVALQAGELPPVSRSGSARPGVSGGRRRGGMTRGRRC